MIKYLIRTGDSTENALARSKRDVMYKPALKGMTCRLCQTDTLIEFVSHPLLKVKAQIHACCPYFEKRLSEKLDAFGR